MDPKIATTEHRVKGVFADYGIRLDKELIAFW
jgi:hypothetical protein